MMRSLRRNTKWIMLIVAVSFVGLMVFQWGMDVSGGSSPTASGQVGKVNGTSISYQAWTQTYRNLADQARDEKGTALNDVEINLVEERAWNQIVNQILIEQELKRRKIRVTDEEVRLAFRSSPPEWLRQNELFQTDGQFDFDKYRAFFSGPAADPRLLQQIEAYYRDVLPRARLMEQVAAGIFVSDAEVWSVYRENVEQVRLEYMAIDPEQQIADADVEISEDDLRAYYGEHQKDYEQPATAETRLVQVYRAPVAADSAAAEESALALREEILAGADFAELAREHSSDVVSGSNGGDLGWFERGDMVPQFEAVAFALDVNAVSDPVRTQFGYHIIEVTERDGERLRASHILIPIKMGNETENELFGLVDRLERLALTRGLDVAADSTGLGITRVTIAEGADFVPGLGAFAPVNHWAFHDSTLIGELSPIYETNDAWFVFELVERQPQGIIPFEEAKASIQRRVTLQKKMEAARELAAQATSMLRSGTDLEGVAQKLGLQVRSTQLFTRGAFVSDIGQINAVIGTAFGLGLNETAGPIEENARLYFIQVSERVEPDSEAFRRDRENLRARLAFQRREAALEQWIEALRDGAEIVDNRREFFQPRS